MGWEKGVVHVIGRFEVWDRDEWLCVAVEWVGDGRSEGKCL